MSGPARTNDSRREDRVTSSSPYPKTTSKKSSWSISNFINYWNPLRKFSEPSSEDNDMDPATKLARRGAELANRREAPVAPEPEVHVRAEVAQTATEPPPSLSPHTSPTSSIAEIKAASTSASNFDTVTSFLREKGSQPLNQVEFAGLVSLLQDSVQDESKPQPFRFSTSSPTPARSKSPTYNFVAPGTPATGSSSTAAPARKTLSKNPNGPYRFQGGGSSRPRNRYHSPVFGRTPQTSSKIKITPEKPKTELKRRRIGTEPESPTPQRAPVDRVNGHPTTNGSSEPSTSLPSLNGTSSSSDNKSPTIGSTPRVRTSSLPKPNTPAIPSPLRQAWGQSDSPPQSCRQPPQPAARPTRAASALTEILKEVAPPKKPEFVNPYEAASPIPPRPATRKPVVQRRTRSAAKPTPSAEAKPAPKPEIKLTAQEIIEATVPKGSKRSRPPPELKSNKPDAHDSASTSTSEHEANAPRRSTRLKSPEPVAQNGINGRHKNSRRYSVEIEEVSDEDAPSPPKKQRAEASTTSVANGRSVSPLIEEVRDQEMADAPPASAPTSYLRPSEIIEPQEKSTSRSISPPSTTTAAAPTSNGFVASSHRSPFFGIKNSAPKAPSKLRFSIQADKEEKEREEKEKEEKEKEDQRQKGKGKDVEVSPASSVPAQVSKPVEARKSNADAKTTVKAMNASELPSYAMELSVSFPSAIAGPGPSSLRAREAAKAIPESELPSYDFSSSKPCAPAQSAPPKTFDWAAAGITKPSGSAKSGWMCSTCGLNNTAKDSDKCTICETPRDNAPKPATTGGFNWAAAGVKPPPSKGDTWTCGTCMLSNSSSATKCTVCDSPR